MQSQLLPKIYLVKFVCLDFLKKSSSCFDYFLQLFTNKCKKLRVFLNQTYSEIDSKWDFSKSVTYPCIPPKGAHQVNCSAEWGGEGVKNPHPTCIHLFSGGARCRHVYPEGHRCIFIFQKQKKSGVSFRCCQVYLKVLRGRLATPQCFQVYLGLNCS